MPLKKIEDFEVWKKVLVFWNAVNVVLKRPAFAKEYNLRDQIKDAIDSIQSNMSEGFEQPTDKAFANYLITSKGSTAEACTRLGQSRVRGCITETELAAFKRQGEEICRMLAGLIKHLLKTPTRRRGVARFATRES